VTIIHLGRLLFQCQNSLKEEKMKRGKNKLIHLGYFVFTNANSPKNVATKFKSVSGNVLLRPREAV
jgi:hypothetical protein